MIGETLAEQFGEVGSAALQWSPDLMIGETARARGLLREFLPLQWSPDLMIGETATPR